MSGRVRGKDRIAARFAQLKRVGRPGLITYVMAGDPDLAASMAMLETLPRAGADLIELGFPFTDPMADGPSIQKAAERALAKGTSLADVFGLVRAFRAQDAATPLVLMGYANPVHAMGYTAFAAATATAGADGAIIVDLPPEEDSALRGAFDEHGLALIRLATPTTDQVRLARILDGADGFLYYVSVAGVTGAGSGDPSRIGAALADIRQQTDLPIAVGFGVRTPAQAKAMAASGADAIVVGSAFADAIDNAISCGIAATPSVILLATELASAVAESRKN